MVSATNRSKIGGKRRCCSLALLFTRTQDAVTSASVHEDNAESATTTGAPEAVVVDAVSSASVK